MEASTSCKFETPTSRKRKLSDEQSDSTNTPISSNENESPESISSHDSGGSTEGKIPKDISKWKEEHIQSLGIVIQYEEKLTPSELLADYTLPETSADKTFLREHLDEFETYFLEFCFFHSTLDKEFTLLSAQEAAFLREPFLYSAEQFLNSHFKERVTDKVRLWFRRLETIGVQFAEYLYFTILKRDYDVIFDKEGNIKDPLVEYDFQFLFDAFVSIFDLRSFKWIEPLIRSSTLELPTCSASGKADIIYCQDIAPNVKVPWDKLENVVAVCEVKKSSKETNQIEVKLTRQHDSARVSSSCTQKSCVPPHISLQELGQLGGELLLYSQKSVFKDVVIGLFVQETKVSFTALKITNDQYNSILRGNRKTTKSNQTKPTLILTRPFDFMKKEDRKYLIKPLLQLAMIQEKILVPLRAKN